MSIVVTLIQNKIVCKVSTALSSKHSVIILTKICARNPILIPSLAKMVVDYKLFCFIKDNENVGAAINDIFHSLFDSGAFQNSSFWKKA